MQSRFGIPEAVFDDYLMFETKRSWWLLRRSSHVRAAASLKVHTYGLRAFERVGRFVKPTTRMIQVFGPWATRAFLDLEEEQFHSVLDGMGIYPEVELEDGYVILSHHHQVLGLGLLIRGRLSLQIRKGDQVNIRD